MATKTGKLVEKKPKRASKSKRIHVRRLKQEARKTVGTTSRLTSLSPPKWRRQTLPY